MNERIKELADQAFDTAEYPEDQRYRIEPNSAFCKKFAELIVKECCDVLQSETIRHDGYGYNQGFLHKKIKQHFGVEK
jgi:hypothetical protein